MHLPCSYSKVLQRGIGRVVFGQCRQVSVITLKVRLSRPQALNAVCRVSQSTHIHSIQADEALREGKWMPDTRRSWYPGYNASMLPVRGLLAKVGEAGGTLQFDVHDRDASLYLKDYRWQG